jgi:hypothetical protein
LVTDRAWLPRGALHLSGSSMHTSCRAPHGWQALGHRCRLSRRGGTKQLPPLSYSPRFPQPRWADADEAPLRSRGAFSFCAPTYLTSLDFCWSPALPQATGIRAAPNGVDKAGRDRTSSVRYQGSVTAVAEPNVRQQSTKHHVQCLVRSRRSVLRREQLAWRWQGVAAIVQTVWLFNRERIP